MATGITTAEQLLRAQHVGRCELVRGELRTLIPPGAEHGRIAAGLLVAIANHVNAQGLGTVFASETGFVLSRDPDTVRAPDVAFVRAGRPPAPRRGYYEGAPDLAVEVLSPDDRPAYVRDKVAEWLQAGARSVWVVDPETRTVTVHRRRRPPATLCERDTLSDDVPPGLQLSVASVFAA